MMYCAQNGIELWFDVEKKYKTIISKIWNTNRKLWFDVEKKYKTMLLGVVRPPAGCGLM